MVKKKLFFFFILWFLKQWKMGEWKVRINVIHWQKAEESNFFFFFQKIKKKFQISILMTLNNAFWVVKLMDIKRQSNLSFFWYLTKQNGYAMLCLCWCYFIYFFVFLFFLLFNIIFLPIVSYASCWSVGLFFFFIPYYELKLVFFVCGEIAFLNIYHVSWIFISSIIVCF